MYNILYDIPKEELYDYVFSSLFGKRRLFTTGKELERLFECVPTDKFSTKEPETTDKVCFLKSEWVHELDKIVFDDVTTMAPRLARIVNWFSPHTCTDIRSNITSTTKTLLITVPEFKSIVLANPAYFDIKDKLR